MSGEATDLVDLERRRSETDIASGHLLLTRVMTPGHQLAWTEADENGVQRQVVAPTEDDCVHDGEFIKWPKQDSSGLSTSSAFHILMPVASSKFLKNAASENAVPACPSTSSEHRGRVVNKNMNRQHRVRRSKSLTSHHQSYFSKCPTLRLKLLHKKCYRCSSSTAPVSASCCCLTTKESTSRHFWNKKFSRTKLSKVDSVILEDKKKSIERMDMFSLSAMQKYLSIKKVNGRRKLSKISAEKKTDEAGESGCSKTKDNQKRRGRNMERGNMDQQKRNVRKGSSKKKDNAPGLSSKKSANQLVEMEHDKVDVNVEAITAGMNQVNLNNANEEDLDVEDDNATIMEVEKDDV